MGREEDVVGCIRSIPINRGHIICDTRWQIFPAEVLQNIKKAGFLTPDNVCYKVLHQTAQNDRFLAINVKYQSKIFQNAIILLYI